MAISPFDSALYRNLFHDADLGRLFTDSAELRAMMLVEGALAKVQGALGLIPSESAAFLHRATLEIQIDPGALAAGTGQSAVCIPALVAAMRKALEAPEHAQYLHWGATSQDIIDTGLMLRLRQALLLIEARLNNVLESLAALAQTHADLPIAARTWGQAATPTSFGAVVASWGQPLLRHRARLGEMRPRLLQVSLSGASGTLSAVGPQGGAVRAGLARALGLGDPGESWHSTRDSIAEFSGWATGTAASLAKMGEDLLLLTQSGIGEVQLGAGGGSSTMPQKLNPVQPTLLVALARHMIGLNANMQSATMHRQQRDGATWLVEWLSLPQMVMALGRALAVAEDMVIIPNPERMAAGLENRLGLIHAEAISFALATLMPRPDAQEAVKALCREAQETDTHLAALAADRWPGVDWGAALALAAQMGDAPAQARRFADGV